MNKKNNKKIQTVQQITLKENSNYIEDDVRDYIFDNPNVLGIENLKGVTKEKIQKSGTRRVDSIYRDDSTIYSTEIQLGTLDGDHIYRSIAYSLNEEENYPQDNHCVILIAERITKENKKVLSLINRQIIVFEVLAFETNDTLSLAFNKKFDNRCKNKRNKKDTKDKRNKNQSTLKVEKDKPKTPEQLREELINKLKENENIELVQQVTYTKICNINTNTIVGSIQKEQKNQLKVHIYIERGDNEGKLSEYLEGKGINGCGNHEFIVKTEKDINSALFLINKAYNKPKEVTKELTKQYYKEKKARCK